MKDLLSRLEESSQRSRREFTTKTTLTLGPLSNEGRVLKKYGGQKQRWKGSLILQEDEKMHKGSLVINTVDLADGVNGINVHTAKWAFPGRYFPSRRVRELIVELAQEQAQKQGLIS